MPGRHRSYLLHVSGQRVVRAKRGEHDLAGQEDRFQAARRGGRGQSDVGGGGLEAVKGAGRAKDGGRVIGALDAGGVIDLHGVAGGREINRSEGEALAVLIGDEELDPGGAGIGALAGETVLPLVGHRRTGVGDGIEILEEDGGRPATADDLAGGGGRPEPLPQHAPGGHAMGREERSAGSQADGADGVPIVGEAGRQRSVGAVVGVGIHVGPGQLVDEADDVVRRHGIVGQKHHRVGPAVDPILINQVGGAEVLHPGNHERLLVGRLHVIDVLDAQAGGRLRRDAAESLSRPAGGDLAVAAQDVTGSNEVVKLLAVGESRRAVGKAGVPVSIGKEVGGLVGGIVGGAGPVARGEILGGHHRGLVRQREIGVAGDLADGRGRVGVTGGDGGGQRDAPDVEPVAQQREPAEGGGGAPAQLDAEVIAGGVAGDLERKAGRGHDGRAARHDRDVAEDLPGDAGGEVDLTDLVGGHAGDDLGEPLAGAEGQSGVHVGDQGQHAGGIGIGRRRLEGGNHHLAERLAADARNVVEQGGEGGGERGEVLAQGHRLIEEDAGGNRVGLLEQGAAQGEGAGVGWVTRPGIDGELFAGQELALGGAEQDVGPVVAVGVLNRGADGDDQVADRRLRRSGHGPKDQPARRHRHQCPEIRHAGPGLSQ